LVLPYMISKDRRNAMDEQQSLLHDKNRLSIIAFLASHAQEECTFTAIQKKLGLTAGNLSSHLTLLEKHNLVCISKSFKQKKPQTLLTITVEGRASFESFISMMENLIDEYRKNHSTI